MKRLFISLILVVFIVGCFNKVVYQNDYGAEQLKNAVDNLVIIKMVSKIKDQKDLLINYAIGIPIKKNYILALDHCVNFKPQVHMRSSFGIMSYDLELEKREYFIDGKRVENVGARDDISVLKSDVVRNYPFSWGDSDEVRIGDKVIVVGYSFTRTINLKQGIIAKIDLQNEFAKFARQDSPMVYLGTEFMHSIMLNGGDSGSPLFAIKGNILEIVGINNAVINGCTISFALKSNYVLENIDYILKKDKLEKMLKALDEE